MTALEQEVRGCARSLLAGGQAEIVIGYAAATLPMQATACCVRDPDEVDRLIFDSTCGPNLARYLVKEQAPRKRGDEEKRERIAILAKGCDGRAAVQLIVEGQIRREDLVIVGLPCRGVIDPHKLKRRLAGREILSGAIQGDSVTVEGRGFEKSIRLRDLLSDCCLTCAYPTPPVSDILIGNVAGLQDNVPESAAHPEDKTPDERWAFFEREFSNCLRCYACRNACPMCYCNDCFVDQNNPRWFGKSTEITDTVLFQAIRALHFAGRCVDCGACVRACPSAVDLRSLSKRVQSEVKERFGYVAGVSLGAAPAMAAFNDDDPQEFIL